MKSNYLGDCTVFQAMLFTDFYCCFCKQARLVIKSAGPAYGEIVKLKYGDALP